MFGYEIDARVLARRVNRLREPYRHNTINWLERCAQRPMGDLETGIQSFLQGLHPVVRDGFVFHAQRVLEDAVRFFGQPE
ncbi:MAG: hypothetical protein A2Z37_05080 [Chloroflexi bacterium RBG_19FT_COMBO_62_14]|nr:MAG: hypothetical protein A2Z37_05080 [Chloroflexi bacterium RBG_19FT_COMBO_62_14]